MNEKKFFNSNNDTCNPEADTDFTGHEFSGTDFTGQEFTGDEFSGQEFTGENFTEQEFTEDNFTEQEFSEQEFTGEENKFERRKFMKNFGPKFAILMLVAGLTWGMTTTCDAATMNTHSQMKCITTSLGITTAHTGEIRTLVNPETGGCDTTMTTETDTTLDTTTLSTTETMATAISTVHHATLTDRETMRLTVETATVTVRQHTGTMSNMV